MYDEVNSTYNIKKDGILYLSVILIRELDMNFLSKMNQYLFNLLPSKQRSNCY